MADELKVDDIKSLDQVPPNIVDVVERGLAIKMGWIPEEQFQGPKEEFISARQFITNTAAINESYRKGQATLTRQLEELNKRFQKQEANHQAEIRNAITKAKQELHEQLRTAASAGDADKHDELMQQLEEVNKQELSLTEASAATNGNGNDALFNAWLDKFPQYNSDPIFKAQIDEYANSFSEAIPFARRLEYATAYAKSITVDSSGGGDGKNKGGGNKGNGSGGDDNLHADMVDGGGQRTGNFGGGKNSDLTWQDIQADPIARSAAESTLRLNPKMTQKEYVDSVNSMRGRRF